MESYKLSSKLRERDREYVIQTVNDTHAAAVATTVYVNGVEAEITRFPHPTEVSPQEVLSLVRLTHDEKKKEIETLLQTYQRIAETGDANMLYHLGTAFFYKGFYIEARDLFVTTLRASADHHQAVYHLGQAELALGQIEAAIESASRAVNMRPMYADYRNFLGEALLANNSTKRAIIELEQAIGINLYYADAYFNLALANLQQALLFPDPARFGQVVAKVDDYLHKAALINPRLQAGTYADGVSAMKSDRLQEAIRLLTQVREKKKEAHRQEFASFYMKFVLFPEMINERAVADRIDFLRGEIARNPNYVDLLVELAQCYVEQAKISLQRGMEQYQKASDMNPSLGRIRIAAEQTSEMYASLCQTAGKIIEKG